MIFVAGLEALSAVSVVGVFVALGTAARPSRWDDE